MTVPPLYPGENNAIIRKIDVQTKGKNRGKTGRGKRWRESWIRSQ